MQNQSNTDEIEAPEGQRLSNRYWYGQGFKNAFSLPTVILSMAFIGFASLAREAGLTLDQVVLMSAFLWALPSIVVLTGAMVSDLALLPTFIAVTLSSVRLMPMTMALIPILREGKKTANWRLLLVSHFVAVTAWVFAMRKLPELPRYARLPFLTGFSITVCTLVICVSVAAFISFPKLPAFIGAALVFLTPIYFMLSMWGASRLASDKLALGLGLILGPIFHLYDPELGLLLTGLVGGTLAFIFYQIRSRGRL
ncbi:branched-chain amino acid ABC transporter permease [Rhodobacteraceae bacterium RKSG542]|uniref:AzlC family ABC transporter permease n=1 Tax=Pseudovibrio flavus TaxID=2529854 RepID=UPI0012BCD739|nr:AzlC family ABC transporter permease [Pseudovibrio flavus]MTI16395.1 branched-chain amino acid ABC transporter permease [Pseudovibrio flavus]